MADSQINHTSSSPYSFVSSQFWCSTCRRTFSHLSFGSSQVNCPRCSSISYEVPSHIASNNTPSSLNATFDHSNNHGEIQDNNSLLQETVTSENIPDDLGDIFGDLITNTHTAPNTENHSNNTTNTQNHQRRAIVFITDNFFGDAGVPVLLYNPETRHFMVIEFLDINSETNGVPPASQEDLNKLEEYKYMHKEVELEEGCPICQEEYKEGDSLVKLHCKHDYHKECVVKWLTQHNACPMCRQAI